MKVPRRLAESSSATLGARLAPALGLGFAALAVGAAGVIGAVATVMARTVVIPPTRRENDTTVRAIADDHTWIKLSVTGDSVVDGDYSFWFDSDTGQARIGRIIERGPASVTRELLGVADGNLVAGAGGRFAGWFYMTPDDLGFPYDDVDIVSDIGLCPAWLIPAEKAGAARDGDGDGEDHDGEGAGGDEDHDQGREISRWAIQVHGRATQRSEGLRAVPVFRSAGFNSLLVSYRNDGDAPASPDGRYGLGDTEWPDVEAAIRFAHSQGAADVVIMGWSMGGAIALQTVTRSDLAQLVSGVVLDSPVIDWVETLRFQATLEGVPKFIARLAMIFLELRGGRALTGQAAPIDLDRLDFVARASELNVPILLLHSDDDGYVPAGASRALAAARRDIVTFVPFSTARHTKLWNYNRAKWEGAIKSWLSATAS